MQKTWKLKRVIQCKECPFKIGSDTNKIPNYDRDKHENLRNTIAKSAELGFFIDLRIMACHHSKEDEPEHCVGWLHNQLGVGNNIPLRMHIASCENIRDLKVIGEQRQSFEDTIPKG